jgi:hypothetical protein
MTEPKNLDECINWFMENIIDEELYKYKHLSEEDTCIFHHGTGRNIRNNWNLWNNESLLHKWFNSIGIYHPDDMSAIILTSLHRHLNNKLINLEEQVKFYQDYWSKINESKIRM